MYILDFNSDIIYNIFFQLPHSYQQLLSAEKCPTLYGTLPAFEGLISKLKQHKNEHEEVDYIIEDGIDKLEEYQQEIANVPAYTLSISQ